MVRSELTNIVCLSERPKMGVLAVCLGLAAILGMGLPAASEDAPGAAVSKAHLEDGKAALDAHVYDRAVLEFERAITADPRNARAFAYLGQAHGQAGRPELARKYYRIALDVDPGEVKALLWDGQMDVAAQNLEAARADLQRMARACARTCDEYRTLEHSIRMLTARLERH